MKFSLKDFLKTDMSFSSQGSFFAKMILALIFAVLLADIFSALTRFALGVG